MVPSLPWKLKESAVWYTTPAAECTTRDDGTLDHSYIDIFELKSAFRAMLRGVSLLVFMTLLKLFKVRPA